MDLRESPVEFVTMTMGIDILRLELSLGQTISNRSAQKKGRYQIIKNYQEELRMHVFYLYI